MFAPRYTITNKLLMYIKQINNLILDLNNKKFPQPVLVKFEKEARAISTYASTSIEGNPLPLTDVKKIIKSRPQNIKTTEQEILNYNQALQFLNKIKKSDRKRLNLALILEIHKLVTDKLTPVFESGKLRKKPVFVNNPKSGETIYLPPDTKDVPQLMTDLIKFTNQNKNIIDPLILAGIFHRQMVIIHPFMDGNGRTARLLTKVLLAEMKLDTFNLFSFENYYNKNITNYFNKVGLFGNYYDLVGIIDFSQWLEYFMEGIVDELLRVKKNLLKFTSPIPETELKTYHHKILSFINEKGYIRDYEYSKLVDRAKATRSLDFKKLIKMGLIVKKGKGPATYYKLID